MREKAKNRKVGVAFSTNRAQAAISLGAEKQAKAKNRSLELGQKDDQKQY
jgi:hypothetical protein